MKVNAEAKNQKMGILSRQFHRVLACLAGAGFMMCRLVEAQPAAVPEPDEIRIVAIQGSLELMPAGATTWVLTQTNQLLHPGDKLRTADDSRVTILWSDRSVVPLGPLTQIEVLPPDKPGSLPGLNFVRGVLSFFHRDKPGLIRILTRGANASIEGTEFVMQVSRVNGEEQDTLSVMDGKVLWSNAEGAVMLTNSQQGDMEPGRRPVQTAGFIANNLLQWCFYYPAVLDLEDLKLTADEQKSLMDSLEAYRAGDLPAALAKYPASTRTVSDSERLYHAALLLSVGCVDQTETELARLSPGKRTDRLERLADSLRTVIAAVKRQPRPSSPALELATELLADSYYEQSQARGNASLVMALDLARRAATLSPQFGFAAARVAELEFSFGRTREAVMDLNRSLALSPRNAQAQALKGFLLAAQNNLKDATAWFDHAIATDGALGNAWLGRGLCHIRRGDRAGGLRDLLIAAAMEPQRSVLRSYLAKAYSDDCQDVLAAREIGIALRLDPGDPTGWLYSALIKQQQNQVNQSIYDMEESQSLNDNRQVFRSKLLLDQDQAVRSVNLATMYNDAGMDEVAVREAAAAVADDYADASAHLFLSDSYNMLRDPTGYNLRYETAWFNELLLANLLSPVGGGRLSQTLSYQEYSKLFESDGVGFANQTSWRSDGQLTQKAGQYGTIQNTSWAGDLEYQHYNGVRANNQLDDTSGDVTIKQQLTPSDTVLGIAQFENYHSGDNFQYYNFYTAYRTNFEYAENQAPTLIAGYQHEWAPGIQTLLLGGRLEGRQRFTTSQAQYLGEMTNYNPPQIDEGTLDAALQDELHIYTAEFSQIVQAERFTLICGGRWQGGQFNYSEMVTGTFLGSDLFDPNPLAQSFSEPFQRLGGYGYLTVEPVDKLWLTGGFAYDAMTYPANFRSVPQSAGTDERQLPEPKAAIVWNPLKPLTLRGIYSRSLGGVSLDDSYRLEPTELAGFVQTFRSVMPESVVGSVSAEDVEMEGLALDLKLDHGTFVGLEAQNIHSTVGQTVGYYSGFGYLAPTSTPQDLDYKEQDFSATINQLLPGNFVTGLSYYFTRSALTTDYPQIPLTHADNSAYLNQLDAYLLFNHPSGFFARFDAHSYFQSNHGSYPEPEPGDDFVQLDLQGGWRFFHRRGELLAGILNLTDQNYSLNPLNPYSELPRSRVFNVQLSFVF